jgi:hypothetical protein
VPKLGKTLKGGICYISGDNLSSNWLAGITTDFKSENTQCCRFCNIKRSDISKGPQEGLTRLNGNYEKDVTAVENDNLTCSNGVKRNCIFSDLSYFKVAKMFPPDILHVIFECLIPT